MTSRLPNSLLTLGLLGLLGGALPLWAAGPPATVIEEGSVASQQVVSVGRDAVIAGKAHSDVAALNGSIYVTGSVEGDVIVLSGDAHLGATATVGGDVFVLGGIIQAAPGARITGRSVAYPTASSAWLTLLEGPTLGISAFSPLVIGTKLALLAAWMALVLLLFAAGGRPMLATSRHVRDEPLRSFVTGLVGVLALVLTGLLFTAVAPGLVGAPLLVLVGLFGLILKLWGMVAVFHALGQWLLARTGRRSTLALNAATVGLIALGIAKFVPFLGAWTWGMATLIGVGATLSSKFGLGEAWFQLGDLEVRSPG